ncbi:MAG: VOC family protein [Ardenticatenaceae bacterium]|nr:VOC family protein [Ardenticatenaceae bacterium]
MQVVKQYPDGLFCWVDLSTTDLEAAKAFYGGLFGWEFDDMPIDMGGFYTMCQIDGYNVAGMGGMSPDMQAQGIPPFWSSYVKHDDVDAIAEKITAAGGMLMFPPMDVMNEGRMAMAQDPSGAAFGVWQPKNNTGAQLVNIPNTLIWNELQTRDKAAANAFYTQVFDWGYAEDGNGYGMYKVGERIQAGMMQMDETWDASIPANWAVYFMVTDADAAAAKASELGGTIIVPVTAAGEMGRFAVVRDPQGGVFTIMQFSGPVDPPPGY